jgi:hypothetical protein
VTTSSLHVLDRSRAHARRSVLSASLRLLEEEALPIGAVCAVVLLLTLSLAATFSPDSWLALVDGRLIAEHGLPHTDTLTFWTVGREWVDQQWGAHLLLYETAAHAGLGAVAILGVFLVGGGLGVCAVAARRLGASPRSAALGVVVPVLAAPWLVQLRTQSFAIVPFVVVYALLVLDGRRPGRRVLWVLPILVVWANLHGSVALGAALVGLHGLLLLRRPDTRLRGTALALGAPLTLLASPYGPALVGYYRLMLLHPPLARYVVEWRPPQVGPTTAIFFATAIGAATLCGAHRRALGATEQVLLPVLLLAAFAAVRNAVWFELAVAVSLPKLLDLARPSRLRPSREVRRVNLVFAAGAIAIVLVVAVTRLSRPLAPADTYAPAAAAAVAAAAGPTGTVIADDRHADWLLWLEPQLEGRVAYDVRFELLDSRQLQQLQRFDHAAPDVWRRCGRGASVVTFAGAGPAKDARRAGVLAPGSRTIAREPGFVAVAQPAGTGGGCHL